MALRSLVLVLVLIAGACTRPPGRTSCTGTSVDLLEGGELVLGSDLTYPPFGYHPTGKDPKGFEIDLVRAVARDLKLELIVANRASGALITGVLAHRHDLAAAGLRDTEELQEQACLSAPYMDADLGILTPNPDPRDITEPGDLAGRTVAVLEGSRAEAWAKEHLDESVLASLPTTDDLLEAVLQRQAEAAIDDLVIARFAAKESKELAVAASIGTAESYVLAAARDNGGLIARVNKALARLKARGGLSEIEAKWFGG